MAVPLPSGVSLSMLPMGHPPPGVQPLNMVNPFTRETAVLVVGVLFTISTSIFVGGRIYLIAITQGRKLGWDDGIVIKHSKTAQDRIDCEQDANK